MNQKEYLALKNALASTQMEGFPVTAQTERDCIRLLSGEVSVEEIVREIVNRTEKAG